VGLEAERRALSSSNSWRYGHQEDLHLRRELLIGHVMLLIVQLIAAECQVHTYIASPHRMIDLGSLDLMLHLLVHVKLTHRSVSRLFSCALGRFAKHFLPMVL
jgi:hypothetical protein